MDRSDAGGLTTYFQPQQQPGAPPPLLPLNHAAAAATNANASPTNGILPHAATPTGATTTTASSPMLYSQNVPPAVSSGLEIVKRKRGRPRKYGTPEQAAAAKRLAAASGPISQSKRKDDAFGTGAVGGGAPSSPNKYQYHLPAVGNTGQAFTPHMIHVAAGEDVGQKIMSFMQQSKRELCILSASGMISNASLRQPAISGGSITYEGRFEIVTLSGSYVHTEPGGRSGGLSVCLVSTDGQIIGGGVGGPLTAAGPIQVIVGTFIIDTKKDITGGVKGGDTSAGKSPSPLGGASFSGVSLWPPIDSSYQNIGGSQFMIDSRSMHLAPSQSMDWRDNPGHDVQQSPENGNYEHLPEEKLL